MEPFKNLSFDFNRVLLQLLIPGATAVFPYYILLNQKFGNINISESVLVTIFFLASIAIGLIIEDIGSQIEESIWGRFKIIKKREYQTDLANGENPEQHDFDKEWDDYLNLTFEENKTPIMVRYIRTLYIRLKFELSFGIAIIIMTIGLHYLKNYNNFSISCTEVYIYMIILPLGISLYCYFEAELSVELMAKNRSKLLKYQSKKE